MMAIEFGMFWRLFEKRCSEKRTYNPIHHGSWHFARGVVMDVGWSGGFGGWGWAG